jgi:DNA mismatch repair protein MutS
MSANETPLMKQYAAFKAKYPDAILLFRVGDFYETFGADAVRSSQVLGITLTKRKNGSASDIELAGFPHHSLDTYLPKLVRAGHRVAICDQLEDPKLAKTIVKRGVTELVTPGVTYNENVLSGKSNNFLASVCFEKDMAGLAFLDISTGEFLCAEGDRAQAEKLIQSLRPSEVIYSKQQQSEFDSLGDADCCAYRMEDWVFGFEFGYERLTRHFGTNTLKGFGIEDMRTGIMAAGAILQYLDDTKHTRTEHISKISRIEEERYVRMDRFTIRNLELLQPAGEKGTSLLDILDKTLTPMGGRLMRRWVVLPLKDLQDIEDRLLTVDALRADADTSDRLAEALVRVGDLERLISKVAAQRIGPREMQQLRYALEATAEVKFITQNHPAEALRVVAEQINPCTSLSDRIIAVLIDNPPPSLGKGRIVADRINEELDALRKIAFAGKDYLVEIQQREIERTGISSLKISYNNVFGYYLEVRNTYKDKVPAEWIRKQTLTQAERYITPELKEYEEKILGAEEKINALEAQIFAELVHHAARFVTAVQATARIISRLDCLLSFARLSAERDYARPVLSDSKDLRITDGRHPVIELRLPADEPYVPNDIFLDTDTQQIVMITGPNMSGKSALLRQTALIVLMAQMGCHVPARGAEIGLVDKIFTRVGASDNISGGESTFMVEMNETAGILNNLSDRSLVLLDEIGRGTSTYDGISIAWAIAEFIHEHPTARAKTLFATHYHELNEMSRNFDRIHNYNVSVREHGNRVVFLRKLQPGGSNHSFGIHVARMAGMPHRVIGRAEEVLARLEANRSPEGHDSAPAKFSAPAHDNGNFQLSFFQLDDPLLEEIRHEIERTDINTLTPVEALMMLNDIKKKLSAGKKEARA